jgi:isopenicillin-N epimerase
MQIATLAGEIARQEKQFETVVGKEYPERSEVYLNTGSSGRKPSSVLDALSAGWHKFNINPTWTTFEDKDHFNQARQQAAQLFELDRRRLLLHANPTQAMHFILSNLLSSGDELVTTDKEHGCVNSISRWLSEERAVKTHRSVLDAFAGSDNLCRGLLNLVTPRTKVILVSEINSYTGWRPNLSALRREFEGSRVELLVDGAHTPGQGHCRPGKYRFWVGSGHKWLGGPSGTGFAVLPPDVVPIFKPLLLGDQYFARKDADADDITRFESAGTSDVVRWWGLAAAVSLFQEIGPAAIEEKQLNLARYLRAEVSRLNPEFRTPDLHQTAPEEATSMVAFYFSPDKVKVSNLRDALWEKHKIWVQPDFAHQNPGLGMRISCHYANTKAQIDKLLNALDNMVKP